MNPAERPDGLPSYAALADAMPNQICILDHTGRVCFVNAAWRTFAAANGHCGSAFVGINYLDICAAAEGAEMADARRVAAGLREVLAGTLPMFEHVYPCHAPGCTRWFRLQGMPFGDGLLLQHVPASDPATAATDPTDMLARVAHELRTPIGAVSGFAELLEMTGAETSADQRVRFTTAIRDSARHMAGLIDDMMELARSSRAGESPMLNETPCDASGLMAEAVRLVDRQAAERAVLLWEAPEPAGGPPVILADRRRIVQVLVNLLGNAVKFSPPDTVVRCAVRRTRSGAVRLEVADQGPGMTAEEIPLALAPYGRASAALRGAVPGLGLGLPLAQALMDLHGGCLDLASTPGAGTTAAAVLPAWRSLPADVRHGLIDTLHA